VSAGALPFAGLAVVAALGAAAGAAVPWLAQRFTTGEPALPSAVTMAVAGAIVFTGLGLAPAVGAALPALLTVAAVGLVLAVVDLTCLRLPNHLVGAAALAALAGLGAAAVLTGRPDRLVGALAGAAVSFIGYALLALLPGARLGYGDVKLAAALGLPLGWLGWPTLLAGLALPHVLHGVVVVGLLAARRVRRDTLLPLGPALLIGAWLAVLLA
jgi:leader peptidase (prepilin peptidase)/N-methyltransferase